MSLNMRLILGLHCRLPDSMDLR